jgi:hypothetical protein
LSLSSRKLNAGVIESVESAETDDSRTTFLDLGGDSMMSIELAWRIEAMVELLRTRHVTQDIEKPHDTARHLPTASELLSESIAQLLARILRASLQRPSEALSSTPNSNKAAARTFMEVAGTGIPVSDSATAAVAAPEMIPAVSWVTRAGLFGGPLGNGLSITQDTALGAPAGGRGITLDFRWRVNLGRCVDASALLVKRSPQEGCVVFIGAHSRTVVSVRAADGCELWRREVVDRSAPNVGDDAAIEATASITVSCTN